MANARIVNTPSQAIPQGGTSHTQTTVSSSVVTPFSSLAADTKHVMIQVLGATIRVTFDGSSPTTTKGFEYIAGSTAYWTRQMAEAAKAIRAGGTDATIESQQLNYL
jgi:hypothetical protein